MANFNLNKVILGGRIASNPETKSTTNGHTVTTCSMVVNRKFQPKGTKSQGDFFNLQGWNKVGEVLGKFFQKGSSICIVGSIQNRNWTDNQGQKHYGTDIVIEEIMFVEKLGASNNADSTDTTYSSGESTAPNFEVIENDDSLPF